MGMLGPLGANLDTDDVDFVTVSARHAPELKILVDAEIATKLAAQAGARLVAFNVSGGGAGAYFECTLCFISAPAAAIPGTGVALTDLSAEFFEAGRATETQAQLARFLTANPGEVIRALESAAGGNGTVFMTGIILDSSATAVVASFASGTAVLVAGTVTVGQGVTDGTPKIWTQLILHGGVAGTRYLVDTVVSGTPGSFDITAVDAAGATVATDTSTLRWFLLNANPD